MGRAINLSNPLLVEYAQGIAKSTITPVGNFIAPTVNVAASAGRYKVYSEKARFRIPNTLRPSGGNAVRVAWDASDATYNCAPNAVDVPLDFIEVADSEAVGDDALMEAADMAAQIGTLAHERDVITAALAAAGAGTGVDTSSADPVASIDAGIDAVALASAGGSITQIRLVFGATAWRTFKNCSAVRSRFTAAGSKAIPNIGLVDASKLFVGEPEIMVARAATDSSAEGPSSSMAYLMTTAVLIFAASSNPNRRDPSFMKTFRLAGNWLGPRTYQTEDGRQIVAGFDWSHDVKVTNSGAVARYNLT